MKNLLAQIFTWWNGQNLNTRFNTAQRHSVGDDGAGKRLHEAVFDFGSRTALGDHKTVMREASSGTLLLAGCIIASMSRRARKTMSRASGRSRMCPI